MLPNGTQSPEALAYFNNSFIKTLLLDIETLPCLGFFWDRPWETSIIHVVKQWQILSFSAKWLGGSQETHIYHKTDKFLLKKIWKLLDEAEIVIYHNGDSFDRKKINARFLYWQLPPPSPYRTIDTLKISRSQFGLISHKQDDIGEYAGTGRKIKVDKQLWLDCIEGKRLKEMKRYNAQDVVLLEKNYLRFRPWIKNHPVLGVYLNHTACPRCTSRSVKREGFRYTNTGKYQQISCKNCYGWSQVGPNLLEIKPLKSI